MIPPLLRLKIVGLLCPCLEKDEDSLARSSLAALSDIPVRWHRRVKSTAAEEGSASAIVGGIASGISGLFGSKSSDGGGGGGAGGSANFSWTKDKAALKVQDSGNGPALVVETVPDENDNAGVTDDEDMDADPSGEGGGGMQLPPKIHTKSYPLVKIWMASAAEGSSFLGMGGGGGASGVVLYGRPHPGASGDRGDELLRFDVLNDKGKRVLNSDRRDDVVHKLTTLIEWDRRRREALGEVPPPPDDDDDDELSDEDDADAPRKKQKKGGVLKGKAAKVAHFAKREIEMREQRRDREKRKARYLEGSGGLKYTAIAMANREMS